MKPWVWLVALSAAAAAMAETTAGADTLRMDPSLSRVTLAADTRVDGIPLAEISGLAWDAREQWLYAVSDRGYLFRLRLRTEDGALRDVVPEAAVMVKRSAGAPGQRSGFDAEGLALRPGTAGPDHPAPRTELLVATEGKPRVLRVDPSGRVLGELALSSGLANAGRHAKHNAMLESVAIHPVHGALVALERPLRGKTPQAGHRLHAVDRHWNIQALDPEASHLKAMDVLDDGHLLVLERSGSGRRRVNTLRIAKLEDCEGPSPCSMQTLLSIDHAGGAENFEGMAYLGNGQVLLVSDNQGRKRAATVFLLVNLPQPFPPATGGTGVDRT